MEFVAWSFLTTLWWMSSMSILLPFAFLLKYNKSFQKRWFSWVYVYIAKHVIEPKFLPLRKQTFQLLKSHLEQRDESIPLKVLEIGIGPGSNLQFYPENSHLTAVDMNASFESYFNKNKERYPQVVYERTVICGAENMNEVKDSCMDVVVSTYCLCSVEDVDSALKEVKRVLKPGGKFLFLEHVIFPSTWWRSTLQRLVNPLWQTYFAGCSVNRDNAEKIKNMRFKEVVCDAIYEHSLLLFLQPQIMGIAIK